MKAENLKLEELVEFSEGVIDFQGRRLVLHSTDAFAQFRKDLFEMLGPEQARRILTRFAYFWGQADAAAMARVFQWDSPIELLKAGPRLHALQGVARWAIKTLELDQKAGLLRIETAWHDSGEAQEHLAQLGKSDMPACWMLAGYASGYFSFALGKPVYFIENRCRAMGDRVCQATGLDVDSWGGEAKPQISYYEAVDIQGHIRRLTSELKKMSRALRGHARQDSETMAGKYVEVHSKAFANVLTLATRIAPFETSVLITGESGVGKEVMARHIHRLSPRAKGPFLAVNCAALPETLLDTELFGHRAGAFTGAMSDRVGVFQSAVRGTIFLDEIGEISQTMQVKLLRVLQEKEVTRVGDSRPQKVDVRVITATNRDLKAQIALGAFREDLYYRLGVIEISIPPLRERREDILPLARFFVERLRLRLKMPRLRLEASSIDFLESYSWPGNVRELENALERAAVLSRQGAITPDLLPSNVSGRSGPTSPAAPPRDDLVNRTLAQVENDHIRAVVDHTEGNRARAAEILGISTTTLWRKLKTGA